MNPLDMFKPKAQKNQEIKDRVLKNKEAVLDIMSKNIEGARQCPFMLGAKCLGQFCEMFMEFFTVDKDGNKKPFWRCAHVQHNLLLIELNSNIMALRNELKKGEEK